MTQRECWNVSRVRKARVKMEISCRLWTKVSRANSFGCLPKRLVIIYSNKTKKIFNHKEFAFFNFLARLFSTQLWKSTTGGEHGFRDLRIVSSHIS